MSQRHVRRLCSALQAKGLARTVCRDGLAAWEIEESADPRFARVKLPDDLPADLARLRERDRTEALRRRDVLRRLEDFCRRRQDLGRAEAVTTFAQAEGLSRATVYAWHRAFRERGIEGLVPQYSPTPEPQISAEAEQAFRRLYLDLRQPSIKACWQSVAYLAGQNGWAWFRSVRSCQRWVQTAFSKPETTLYRKGERAYNAECGPYLVRDYAALAGNEQWVGDHHQLDLWCRSGKRLLRPWLTAWMDMRSRVIAGWVLSEQPNQATILAALRAGCLAPWGPPQSVYVDNGRDYCAAAFTGETKTARRRRILDRGYLDEPQVRGLLGMLGCAVTFARPYNPQSKPIERLFRTVADQFSKGFATYCGRDPQHRPENCASIIASGREVPAFADVEKQFARWVESYHRTAHQGREMDGRAPLDVLSDTQIAKRAAPAEVLDLLLCLWSRPVRVGKGGAVRWNNLVYGLNDPQTFELQDREVRVAYDPRDASAVTLWDLEGRLLCRVRAAGVPAGLRDADLREANALKRRITRTLRAADDLRRLAHRDVSELAAEAAMARATGGDYDPGELPIRPIQSDLDVRLAKALRPMRRAEGDDVIDISDAELVDAEEEVGPAGPLDDELERRLTLRDDGET